MLFFCSWQYCCTYLLEFKYFQVINIFQFGNSKLPEREDFFLCIVEVDCLYESEYPKKCCKEGVFNSVNRIKRALFSEVILCGRVEEHAATPLWCHSSAVLTDSAASL
jgi:hypothetical protein